MTKNQFVKASFKLTMWATWSLKTQKAEFNLKKFTLNLSDDFWVPACPDCLTDLQLVEQSWGWHVQKNFQNNYECTSNHEQSTKTYINNHMFDVCLTLNLLFAIRI